MLVAGVLGLVRFLGRYLGGGALVPSVRWSTLVTEVPSFMVVVVMLRLSLWCRPCFGSS